MQSFKIPMIMRSVRSGKRRLTNVDNVLNVLNVLGKMQRAEFNSKCVQVKLFARHQNPSLVDSC